MDPRKISINHFAYHLPDDRIALRPLPERDASKLLVYKEGKIIDSHFNKIDHFIPEGSLFVFNNTKVVEARLLFQKPSGGLIEIFCLSPHEEYPDITHAMNQTQSVKWLCFIGGASKWKKGVVLEMPLVIDEKKLLLKATYLEKRKDCFVIGLDWGDTSVSFSELLHHAGKIPLPPYIKRELEPEDAERYQTTYSRWDGSVAAPTAGLHFTQDSFQRLSGKNISREFVTLHVGAGTFKPVHSKTMEGHDMHAEALELSLSFLKTLINNIGKPIIAVGTTTLRTLETLHWMGVKLLRNPTVYDNALPSITQWEAYNLATSQVEVKDSLQALSDFLEKKQQQHFVAKTQILIVPGYRFKIVNALVTNFHQPASTLLLLVAAFIGARWEQVYQYALENEYRFLSYGDSSLLWAED